MSVCVFMCVYIYSGPKQPFCPVFTTSEGRLIVGFKAEVRSGCRLRLGFGLYCDV